MMQTTITARHCEVSDLLRKRAITVVERLGNLASRPMDMTVVFDAEGGRLTVELRLHVARGEILIAKGEGADHRSALDRAEAKLRRQVERASDGPRKRRSARAKHTL
jgi:ribosome-associated translation inhibitor RaiA